MLIFQGWHRDVRTSTRILFKAYINDMLIAIEAAKQRVTVGEDTVWGLILTDDFVGISETPKGPRKPFTKTLEYTRKWSDSERKHVLGSCI